MRCPSSSVCPPPPPPDPISQGPFPWPASSHVQDAYRPLNRVGNFSTKATMVLLRYWLDGLSLMKCTVARFGSSSASLGYKKIPCHLSKREGDCLPVVGFLLVSFIKLYSSPDWISYTIVCSRPEDGLRSMPAGLKLQLFLLMGCICARSCGLIVYLQGTKCKYVFVVSSYAMAFAKVYLNISIWENYRILVWRFLEVTWNAMGTCWYLLWYHVRIFSYVECHDEWLKWICLC